MPAENSLGFMSEKPNSHETPSLELRFVMRAAPAPELGPSISRNMRILQQMWVIYHHPPGEPANPYRRETEWRDVPLVEGE